MTADWVRRDPVAVDAPDVSSARARQSTGPLSSLVIGRFLNTVVLSAHGALDLSASEGLARALHDLIDGQGNLAVVVNLAEVCGIDHSCLKVLTAAADRLSARGGQLGLAGPTGTVLDSLVRAGLGRLVTIPHSQAHRPASPVQPPARASRRAATAAHPAGSASYHHDERGDSRASP